MSYTVYQVQEGTKRIQKKNPFLIFFLSALIVSAVVAVIVYVVINTFSPTSPTSKGAVVTNGYKCAQIGGSILRKGGTAVEAAIAALFCEGVSMPQSMGLGGGFLMTIYSKEQRKSVTLNARETAPAAADENMFNGDLHSSTVGGKSVGVPGELKGYWEAYKRYGGKTRWRDLVQPTIDLCKEGVVVTKYLEMLFASQRDNLYNDPGLREEFINPKTNQTYRQNEKVKRHRLAKTLELIAEQGAGVLYNGSLTAEFTKDIRDNGGIISEEDMNNYTVEWQESIKINLPFDQVLYSVPLPGSGAILGFIMNILGGFLDYSQPNLVSNWQRIAESFKWGYARRTELGDMNYVDVQELVSNLTSPKYAHSIRTQIKDDRTSQNSSFYGAETVQAEDHGTAHICVLAPNGDAVSVTSTINLFFGAQFMSLSTGIILNDEMDDFSSPNLTSAFDIPPSEANFIRPGKRPFSSMCPTIIVNQDNNVELIIGAAGGTKITTSVVTIAIKHLWFNMTIQDAVDDKRMHHQLFPMVMDFEQGFQHDMEIPNALQRIGHVIKIDNTNTGFSAVTAISLKNKMTSTATDVLRRSGDVFVL